jgi:hypothetical protein
VRRLRPYERGSCFTREADFRAVCLVLLSAVDVVAIGVPYELHHCDWIGNVYN